MGAADTVAIDVSGRRTEFKMAILAVQWLIGKEELCDLAVGLPVDFEGEIAHATRQTANVRK